MLQKLKTGDYAGIYSPMQGLDVSHVGIIIRDKDTFFLRHASSDRRFRKVVDQELQEYISGTTGPDHIKAQGSIGMTFFLSTLISENLFRLLLKSQCPPFS